MPSKYILSDDNRDEILRPTNTIRVGMLSPICKDGQVALCKRWAEPFLNRGVDVILIPVGTTDLHEVLDRIDGLILPGGDSNIHPSFYTPFVTPVRDQYDYDRDVFAMDLAEAAYHMKIPTLGICRGMQEMIVTFGGHLKKLEVGKYNHALGYNAIGPDGKKDFEVLDMPVHPVYFKKGGKLSLIYNDESYATRGLDRDALWNSVHYEGIDEKDWQSARNKAVREVLNVEGAAPDGVVEAVSAPNHPFFIGIQAHIELPGPLHEMLLDTPEHGLMAHILKRYEKRVGLHRAGNQLDAAITDTVQP